MAHTLYDRTLAFAGICQAAKLVQDTAREGRCDEQALSATLASILNTNPANTLEVYGQERDLRSGLKVLTNGMSGSSETNELMRYVVSLIALERKLSSQPELMQKLGQRIQMAQYQREHYELLDENYINNLASIYVDVISPLGPRIQVTGTPAQLQKQSVQNQVRALLLAGIRSTVLWRQVGGKRRQLLLGRSKIVQQANILLARL
ncbi:High frequency lysogenization protein HflD [Vibrio stylophorae]|uniref:High frequency lysogenization protein HflD homolog n=1 Tax=Vibrio stylophorae TaxID=659351 RepID=A0ABN8DSY4_9VIBR|nr:high frequency lysogenization protein HflD [Vibrio stylophorae]CAH0533359.1 High frequency lysogenization protein HflD [Vibrio stylophorae]